MKQLFLCEIFVHSLISQPCLLQGERNWRSLKDRWEIIGRWMRSLSAPWDLLEHSLSVPWAFLERSLPLVIIERLFWTESKLWGDRGDHSMISDRSFRDIGVRWALFERSLRNLYICVYIPCFYESGNIWCCNNFHFRKSNSNLCISLFSIHKHLTHSITSGTGVMRNILHHTTLEMSTLRKTNPTVTKLTQSCMIHLLNFCLIFQKSISEGDL